MSAEDRIAPFAGNDRGQRDPRVDPGHYFDQTVLPREALLLAARAETLALNDELAALGVWVDPVSGEVSLRSPD